MTDKKSVQCHRCSHTSGIHKRDGMHECLFHNCDCAYFIVPVDGNDINTPDNVEVKFEEVELVSTENIFYQTNESVDLESNYRRIAIDLGMDPELIESSLRDLENRTQKTTDDVIPDPFDARDPYLGLREHVADLRVEATRPDVPLDAINPSHYRDGKIEVWDFIVDKKLDYCLGAAVKYISRAGKKGGAEKELEDLKKAQNYIGRKIREIEERFEPAFVEKDESRGSNQDLIDQLNVIHDDERLKEDAKYDIIKVIARLLWDQC